MKIKQHRAFAARTTSGSSFFTARAAAPRSLRVRIMEAAASFGGKPCFPLGMPTSPFGERINGRRLVTRMLPSSGRRADRCRGL